MQQWQKQLAKIMQPPVLVTFRGGLYVARFAGAPNFCFGETQEQATQRVENSPWAKDHKRLRKPKPH